VVAGVDDDLRLRPERDALHERGAPVGHVHRVERRLEQLVFEHDPLVRPEAVVDDAERLGEPVLAPPDVVLARVVRAVGEPQLEVARAGRVHDIDALEQVVDGLLPDPRVGVADAAQHVVVVLERVRVDRPQRDAQLPGVGRERGVVVHLVPGDVEGDRRRDAGVGIDLRRVGDLLVRVARHARLREHLEPGPGVPEGP
jgi:hypothetical protein